MNDGQHKEKLKNNDQRQKSKKNERKQPFGDLNLINQAHSIFRDISNHDKDISLLLVGKFGSLHMAKKSMPLGLVCCSVHNDLLWINSSIFPL